MASISDWYSQALKSIPGLPRPALIDAGRDACRDFCRETWLWRYTLPLISVVALTSAYTLTIPSALYADLENIPDDGVRFKESGATTDEFFPLTCTSEQELDSQYKNWRYETAPLPSRFHVDNIDKKVNLTPIPENASASGLEVTCILKPSKTAELVPDFLYDDYEKVITAGILADLFMRKSEEWHDPQEAVRNAAEFRIGCNDAKMKRFTGRTNKPMQVKMRFFA